MNKITLLDGGVGQEIYRRSQLRDAPLWSVEAMLEEIDVVTQVHRDFIEAGAQILTLNTYTATPTRLRNAKRISDFDKIHKLAEIALANAIPSSIAILLKSPDVYHHYMVVIREHLNVHTKVFVMNTKKL